MGESGQRGYDLIGGEHTLVNVVDDLCGRVLADPRLRAIEHFDLVVTHLDDALHAAGVPRPTAEEIISVVAPLGPEIVSRPLMS
jgi:truncated hemoglobin YjbI